MLPDRLEVSLAVLTADYDASYGSWVNFDDDTGAWAQVRVRGMACLSSCSRACSVAFQAPGKHTFVFGDLQPDAETARHVLECGAMHARASGGMLHRNERPERLKSGIVARLPPFGSNPES